jgi:hypothetical protein
MSLLDAFSQFKNGTRKSLLYNEEETLEKQAKHEEKNSKQADKDKKAKEDLKEPCHHCNGTGMEPGTEKSDKGALTCHTCLGRGWFKKRPVLNLKAKDEKQRKKRKVDSVGNKTKKRIIQLFLVEGLTIEEIGNKLSLEDWIIEQVISDLRNKLEDSLNKQNQED